MNAPASAEVCHPSPAALDLMRTLVAFDTTSRESNLALIDWVRAYFATFGIDSALTFDDSGRKANLFATIPAASGEARAGGIVLSGHTDVVPVDGQPWTTDPWTVRVDGERLVGRGVCDMKGFCALVLAAVPDLARRRLSRPVHFAFSYDEEVGCIGVRRLISGLADSGIEPSGCIIGEPTGMRLIVAHKGKKTFVCRIRGREAHSALMPLGVNAVQIGCELVAHLGERARRFRDQGPFDPAYDVPYTTVHVGVIHGGTAVNIVPRDCHFVWEVRNLPPDDPDEVLADLRALAESKYLPAMRAVDPATSISFEEVSSLSGMDTHDHSEVARLGRACCGDSGHGKVSFATEAALFDAAGIPTVICGPGHIEQAHQPDEWVSLDQLGRGEAFLRRLAERVSLD
jgi:acetylornithine deacetylase